MTATVMGMHDLKQFLMEFPEKLQRRVIRLALKKASAVVVAEAKSLFPRGRKPGVIINNDGTKRPREWHTQDKFTNKAWNRKDVSVQIVGVESGFGRLTHLVEDGTVDRYHRSRTRLAMTIVGTKVKSRRVKLANGGYRTVKETVNRSVRRGTGSRDRLTGSMTGSGRGKFVGRMTASHPLARAMSATDAQVQEVLRSEIQAGLEREIARQSAKSAE